MFLRQLSIINYKNLSQIELDLSPKLNCFIGNNGMGKTNLLDAIYYLSFCKSHTNPVDSQIIRHNSDFCMLQGKYEFPDHSIEEVFCAIRRRQKKQFKRNKKEYERLSDHIGFIPLVMISPADNELIIGGSDERRRFMDMVISQYDKNYMHSLIRYNRALQQRNIILKNEEENIDLSLLEIWEEQITDEGMFIFKKRQAFIDQFIPIFNRFYTLISRSNETVSLNYISQLKESDLNLLLKKNRKKDMMLGYTTIGIHKDDLEMLLNDFPIKKTGSQGQNKTFFVSMKLAQFHFLLETTKNKPLLLLDDIFDRLDSSRVEEIIKLVLENEFGQIFISDTNRKSLDKMLEKTAYTDYHLYSVKNGYINQITD